MEATASQEIYAGAMVCTDSSGYIRLVVPKKFYKMRVRDKWSCLFFSLRWMLFYLNILSIKAEDGERFRVGRLYSLTELLRSGLFFYRFHKTLIQDTYDRRNRENLWASTPIGIAQESADKGDEVRVKLDI